MGKSKARSLIGDPEIEAKVLEAIRQHGRPVSVSFIARALGVSWPRAKELLADMVSKGKLITVEVETPAWWRYPEWGYWRKVKRTAYWLPGEEIPSKSRK